MTDTRAPSLTSLFRLHGSDKDCPGGHSYGPIYEEFLNPVRDTYVSVLELGVLGGASLRAWRDFFPNATVVGLDHDVIDRDEGRVIVRKADVTNPDHLAVVMCDGETFDVIVDDASHWEGDQLKSFDLLKSRLNPGGLYFVEDIQCVESHEKFKALGFEVFDRRGETTPYRFDDVIAVYRAPSKARPCPVSLQQQTRCTGNKIETYYSP